MKNRSRPIITPEADFNFGLNGMHLLRISVRKAITHTRQMHQDRTYRTGEHYPLYCAF